MSKGILQTCLNWLIALSLIFQGSAAVAMIECHQAAQAANQTDAQTAAGSGGKISEHSNTDRFRSHSHQAGTADHTHNLETDSPHSQHDHSKSLAGVDDTRSCCDCQAVCKLPLALAAPVLPAIKAPASYTGLIPITPHNPDLTPPFRPPILA